MKQSSTATRIVTFAPDGVGENDALNTILDDILSADTRRIEGVDLYAKLRLFIEAVGMCGDYLVASDMSVVIGHIADAFCNLGGIRRRRGTTGPQILHQTKFHC